jgi:quinol-cytochrome oxidoreductase complex cytochrome b subunit/NAD-dependent dihydropyrimidine dehydrogenase PreA subunit
LYKRILRSLQRTTLQVDVALNRILPSDWNPLYYTGGLSNLFLTILILSGIFLFFYYVPDPNEAHRSITFITERVPYGRIIRGVHRYAADGFMVAILLHLFRNWFTERYLFSRDIPWISGMFLLGFTGFVGITGYFMAWDDRAQALLAMTLHTLRSIPLLGPWLSSLLLGGQGVGEGTLVRFLFLHVVPAVTLYLLLWWHYIRIRHPKIWPPAVWVLFSLGAVFLLSSLVPVVSGTPASPTARPQTIPLDVLYMWPYWLLKYIGPLWVIALGVVLFAYGMYIPYQLREGPEVMGVRHAGVAQVIEPNCTGCELCYYDCPYNAIIMVPSPRPGQTKAAQNRKLLAVVIESRCVECGICIGACPFQALELPRLMENQVLERVLAACRS